LNCTASQQEDGLLREKAYVAGLEEGVEDEPGVGQVVERLRVLALYAPGVLRAGHAERRVLERVIAPVSGAKLRAHKSCWRVLDRVI